MQPKRRLSVAVVLWSVFVMAFAAFLAAAPSAMAPHDSGTWTNYGDLAGADHFHRWFGGGLGAGNVLYVPHIPYNTNTAFANINLTKLTAAAGPFNPPVVLL